MSHKDRHIERGGHNLKEVLSQINLSKKTAPSGSVLYDIQLHLLPPLPAAAVGNKAEKYSTVLALLGLATCRNRELESKTKPAVRYLWDLKADKEKEKRISQKQLIGYLAGMFLPCSSASLTVNQRTNI